MIECNCVNEFAWHPNLSLLFVQSTSCYLRNICNVISGASASAIVWQPCLKHPVYHLQRLGSSISTFVPSTTAMGKPTPEAILTFLQTTDPKLLGPIFWFWQEDLSCRTQLILWEQESLKLIFNSCSSMLYWSILDIGVYISGYIMHLPL